MTTDPALPHCFDDPHGMRFHHHAQGLRFTQPVPGTRTLMTGRRRKPLPTVR